MNVFLIVFTSFCLITNVVYAIFSLLSRQITFTPGQILLFILVYIVKLLTFKTFLIFSLFLSSQNNVTTHIPALTLILQVICYGFQVNISYRLILQDVAQQAIFRNFFLSIIFMPFLVTSNHPSATKCLSILVFHPLINSTF